MAELDRKIAEAQKVLDSLKAQQAYEEKLAPKYKLARMLHEKLCRYNHTDGCSWFYFVKGAEDDWTDYSHATYLAKAVRMLAAANGNGKVVLDVVEAM